MGERASEYMKSKTKYRSAPKRNAEALAAPDKLVFKETTAKITLSLSKTSIHFFKAKASKYDVPYQTMIKKVVDLYAQQHQK